MMDEALSISLLCHYSYCPRSCALIALEGDWADNEHTIKGTHAHQAVDLPEGVLREGVRFEGALPIWSKRFGLIGKADIVEFDPNGTPYPVEHKLGNKWKKQGERMQLAAQAVCLEEMFDCAVPEGALYHRKSKRRTAVAINHALRLELMQTISSVREILDLQVLPQPVNDARCEGCSLSTICMPEAHSAMQHFTKPKED